MLKHWLLMVLFGAIALAPMVAISQVALPINPPQQLTTKCFEVQGELRSSEGWPPNIIIRSGKVIYGVPEEVGMYPEWIDRDYPLSRNKLRGKFQICPVGYAVDQPSGDKYEMYCVFTVISAEYMHFGNEEGDRSWHEFEELPKPTFNLTCSKILSRQKN